MTCGRGGTAWDQELGVRTGKWNYTWRKGTTSMMGKKGGVFLHQHELLEKLAIKAFISKREATEQVWRRDWKRQWLTLLKNKAQEAQGLLWLWGQCPLRPSCVQVLCACLWAPGLLPWVWPVECKQKCYVSVQAWDLKHGSRIFLLTFPFHIQEQEDACDPRLTT